MKICFVGVFNETGRGKGRLQVHTQCSNGPGARNEEGHFCLLSFHSNASKPESSTILSIWVTKKKLLLTFQCWTGYILITAVPGDSLHFRLPVRCFTRITFLHMFLHFLSQSQLKSGSLGAACKWKIIERHSHTSLTFKNILISHGLARKKQKEKQLMLSISYSFLSKIHFYLKE